MKIFSIKSVPVTHWSSEKPLNFRPSFLTIFILCIGLTLFGLGESLLITSGAGNSPWTVLAHGLSIASGLSIGALTFIISVLVLIIWIPLKQSPGMGTLLNVIIIAAVIEWSLPYLPHPKHLEFQLFQAVCGILLVGFATGLYLIANLGPGPRDGLMTGLQRVTGQPIAWVRTLIEIGVVTVGWALGGSLGLGTLLFALGIGSAVSLGLFCVEVISKR